MCWRHLSIAILLLGSGCAAAPLAAVGTAVGIAGTAVSTGADVYSFGKLDSAEALPLEDLRAGIFLAADAMSLETEFENVTEHGRLIRFKDDQNAEIDVTLDERTPTLTRLRINVGKTGHEPTARLFLRLAREHLKLSDEL